MNRLLHHAAFAAGLIAIGWIGAGYLPGNPLALSLVLLIGAFFLMGALELHRFQQATASLGTALVAATDAPPTLAAWLATVHPSLHPSVRLRVEGERVPLPGPALTPYLAGLLVLLGMLGTFLGMVVTLKGTGLALEQATDIEAIRASLAAPVRGLGLAFGTSVAGVAASAMLGLMSALVRRDRLRVAQQLDTRIATTLRGFSQAHQREESLRLLRVQSDVMPAVVTQLEALVDRMQQQHQALHDRLLDSQATFQSEAQRAYTGLAASVDRSLQASLAESARLAGAAIEPAVQATMAGLTREAGTLRDALADTARQQLDAVTTRLDATTTTLVDRWRGALVEQQRHSAGITQDLQAALDRFTQTFEQRTTTLVDGVAARLDDSTARWTAGWGDAVAQQRDGHEALLAQTRDGWTATTAVFEREAAGLLQRMADTHAAAEAAATARERDRLAAWGDAIAQQRDGHEALVAQTRDGHQALAAQTRDGWTATTAAFEHQAAALLQRVADTHAAAEAAAIARERDRLAAFDAGLAGTTAALQRQAEAGAAALAERQQQICTTLEQTAAAITAQGEAHARATIGEIARLVQAASEAPRAAAEVIGELRGALSDSLVRDNAALDERNRLLATLGGLLDAVNHASTEQRAAIDALVQASTDVLDRTGTRFHETVAAGTQALESVAAQVTVGAAEVASLGEGFGVAVDLFSRASEQMLAQLQRIESALGHTMTRSDEQLAYYVAQAREIVDLTLGSQKQIVEDLQQLGRPPAPSVAPAEVDAA